MASLLRAVLATSATALILAGPAHAQVPAPVPVNTQYFFQCAGPQPAAKVQTSVAAWSTTAPAASYTTGAGCGFADTLLASNPAAPPRDAVFEGTHTGPVASITLDLHELLLSHVDQNVLGGVLVGIGLEVDGVKVATTGTALTVPLKESASGLSHLMEVTFTNLKVTDDAEHTYRVIVQKYNTAAAWVFGASEIASGVEFNPAKPAPFKIRTT